jgi:hypothetical protein
VLVDVLEDVVLTSPAVVVVVSTGWRVPNSSVTVAITPSAMLFCPAGVGWNGASELKLLGAEKL